jgi:hypothetical protein
VSAYDMGKTFKIGSAYLALFINIPFNESRPMIWVNTLT